MYQIRSAHTCGIRCHSFGRFYYGWQRDCVNHDDCRWSAKDIFLPPTLNNSRTSLYFIYFFEI